MPKTLEFLFASAVSFILYLILIKVIKPRLNESMGWKTDLCFISSSVCAISTVVFFVFLAISIISCNFK